MPCLKAFFSTVCITTHRFLFCFLLTSIFASLPQVKDFVQCVSGSSSLYGLQPDTLESLVLTLLPPLGHKYDTLGDPSIVDSSLDVRVYVLQELLQSLRHCAGFHIPPVSLCGTCRYVFQAFAPGEGGGGRGVGGQMSNVPGRNAYICTM